MSQKNGIVNENGRVFLFNYKRRSESVLERKNKLYETNPNLEFGSGSLKYWNLKTKNDLHYIERRMKSKIRSPDRFLFK